MSNLPLTARNFRGQYMHNYTHFSKCKFRKCKRLRFKIGVLKHFAIFTEKHLRWSLFLLKSQACNFIKKKLQHRCFPVKICEIFKNKFHRTQNTFDGCF